MRVRSTYHVQVANRNVLTLALGARVGGRKVWVAGFILTLDYPRETNRHRLRTLDRHRFLNCHLGFVAATCRHIQTDITVIVFKGSFGVRDLGICNAINNVRAKAIACWWYGDEIGVQQVRWRDCCQCVPSRRSSDCVLRT